jgi:hypothetical protein
MRKLALNGSNAFTGRRHKGGVMMKRNRVGNQMIEREALLTIGAQHPAWSANPNDNLVRIFNEVTKLARKTVGARGRSDDQKADWCSRELEKMLSAQTDNEENRNC